jgi:hypothetical protein
MAYLAHLYERLTFKYRNPRDGDDEQYVCTAKVLAPSRVTEPTDYDDGGVVTFRVIAPASYAAVDIRRAIRDSFTRGGCSHEYDCCGCAHNTVHVERLNARNYRVTEHTYYNY